VSGGSCHKVLEGEYRQWSGLLVRHACACQSRSACSEQVDAKSALPVDELKQRLASCRAWMNVVQQEPIGHPPRDGLETRDDKVHIVERMPVAGATVRA
jgi:hypothetical protein